MLSRFVEGKGQGAFYNTLHYARNYGNLYSNHLNSGTLPRYIRNVHEHLEYNMTMIFFFWGINHEIIDSELDNLFLGVSAAIIDSVIPNLHGY